MSRDRTLPWRRAATAAPPDRCRHSGAVAPLESTATVKVKRLQETSGASYPTVATVLKELTDKGWLENGSECGVRLRHLTISEWM